MMKLLRLLALICLLAFIVQARKPDFTKMWRDPVAYMPPQLVEDTLGGDLKDLGNYCAIRVSHALNAAGDWISMPSDFRDSQGNRYIIRVTTLMNYLTSKYGPPIEVNEDAAQGKRGIIVFNGEAHGWSDQSSHTDLWDGKTCAYRCCWDAASLAYLWEL